jgi:MarR family transcriptional regulator, lower aerobic nicotinate degradation pathway regulator
MPRTKSDANSGPFDDLWDRPGYLLRRAYQRNIAIFDDECAEYGVTAVQYAMLTMLQEVPRLEAASLIRAAGVDEATGNAALRALQNMTLVERDNSRLDRRIRPVKLTDTGLQLMANSRSAMQRAQGRLLEALSAGDRVQLIALLKTIVGAGIAAERSSSSSPAKRLERATQSGSGQPKSRPTAGS